MELLPKRDRTVITLWLTCYLFAIQPYGGVEYRPFHYMTFALCLFLVLWEPALVSARSWLVLSTGSLWVLASNWHFMDNHKYLMWYWSLAVAIALSQTDSFRVLKDNARLLIGLSFFFATLWKLLGGEFLDGSFYGYIYLTPGIFTNVARLFGGVSMETLESNYELYRVFEATPDPTGVVFLNGVAIVRGFSLFSAYWTIVVELFITICFLAPNGSFVARFRHLTLLLFLCTTYFIAPVAPFAILLATLGYTQVDDDQPFLQLTYLMLFVLLQFSSLMLPLYGALARTLGL